MTSVAQRQMRSAQNFLLYSPKASHRNDFKSQCGAFLLLGRTNDTGVCSGTDKAKPVSTSMFSYDSHT